MPCPHKFRRHLNLDHLDFKPTTLIVGTFNPSWPAGNYAEWFYGRTQNNCFWNILPRLYGEYSLANATSEEWKSFCSRHRIAITDLISCIEDADEDNDEHVALLEGYGDNQIVENFNQFEITDIVNLLSTFPTINNVYLTRGPGPFWNALWTPVRDYAAVTPHFNHANMLLTPSKMARFSLAAYNRNNPNPFDGTLCDYILGKWTEQWHNV